MATSFRAVYFGRAAVIELNVDYEMTGLLRVSFSSGSPVLVTFSDFKFAQSQGKVTFDDAGKKLLADWKTLLSLV